MVKTKKTVSTHKPLNLNCLVKYIQEQEGKDVFKYSVFGSPNQKIGQFAQSKLGDFSG